MIKNLNTDFVDATPFSIFRLTISGFGNIRDQSLSNFLRPPPN